MSITAAADPLCLSRQQQPLYLYHSSSKPSLLVPLVLLGLLRLRLRLMLRLLLRLLRLLLWTETESAGREKNSGIQGFRDLGI